jgi:hypothetical protein
MARFQPGNQANLQGRPKGITDRRLRFRKELEKHGGELLQTAIRQALAGDVAMLKCLIERLIPAIKAESPAIKLPVPDGATLADFGRVLIEQTAAGVIAPAETASLMTALTAQARLLEVEDFDRRLTALEAQRDEPRD